jgi:hypothetical protein
MNMRINRIAVSRGDQSRTTKLASLATALATSAVLGVGLAAPSSAASSSATASATAASAIAGVTATSPFKQVPVTGTTTTGGTVAGVLDIVRFDVRRDGHTRALYAIGTFTGSITDSAGTVLKSGSEQVALPVDVTRSGSAGGPSGLRGTSAIAAAQPGACDILNLVLGPLDLNLLGLEVHLNQVLLDIVAQSGAGNLLGNLLCAVAGLLDGASPIGGILNGIAALLNRILAILG